jgi:hypothetical protein
MTVKLTAQQTQTYFEARLTGQRFSRSGGNFMTKCPFHADGKASLSLHFGKGAWKCFAGCGQGGVVDFERKFSTCDSEIAAANIAEICGLSDLRLFRQKPEATYVYRDEDGNVLFEKLRFPGKKFSQRAPSGDGRWVYKLDGVRKVLYNLPELVRASDVAVTEGEKDADNVNVLNLAAHGGNPSTRFVATTNFEGAGVWRPEYSPFFTGKHTIIFEDNDAAGRASAVLKASSIFPYAHDVRVVRLPGLGEHGDVSDYLQTHDAKDLLAEIRKTPIWKPATGTLLVPAPQFLTAASIDIEWLVDGVIQRGSNGFICSLPKMGKSWLAVDLAISLTLGLPWVGFDIPRAVKAALITREDNPALTRWRMAHLLAGRNRAMAELEGRLCVNSREQSPEFRVDKADFLGPMIAELKAIQPEFVILDVLNVLHSADENDNTEMRAVVEELSRLQREVGCSLGVVHHFNKGEGTLTQRLRGATAIAGWAEWLIGIEGIPGEPHTRQMQFELKAASQPNPLYYTVRTDESACSTRIERAEWVPKSRGRKAEEIVQ